MGDRDRAGILDFLERALLRNCRTGEQAEGSNCHDHLQTHQNPRKIYIQPLFRHRHDAGNVA